MSKWRTRYGFVFRTDSKLGKWIAENHRRLLGLPILRRVTMYDSTTPAKSIPKRARAVAGYVDGRWPTFYSLASLFPHALRVSIAVFATAGADFLDIEAGNAKPAQAPGWVNRQRAAHNPRPGVYSSLDGMISTLAELEHAGIKREEVKVWIAHPTGKPHICTHRCDPRLPRGFKADGTQWRFESQDPKHRNLDTSLCRRSFFKP